MSCGKVLPSKAEIDRSEQVLKDACAAENAKVWPAEVRRVISAARLLLELDPTIELLQCVAEGVTARDRLEHDAKLALRNLAYILEDRS